MAEEGETAHIPSELKVYKMAHPICDPIDAPVNTDTTTIEWTRTLDSLSGTLSCREDFNMYGSNDVSCDDKGKENYSFETK